LQGVRKLLCMITHCFSGLITIWIVFPKLTSAEREQRVTAWAKGVLRALKVELIVTGQPGFSGPLMLVANHTSWLDIASLHASLFSRFVAKHELRPWPVIGFMAAQSGTLFLERRSRRDALRVVHQIAKCLQDGEVVAVFPEGTTGDGASVLPFHGNLLQAAISVNAPVQPVYIQYRDSRSGRRSDAPNYVGEVHFLVSLWATLCAQNLSVCVHFGTPQWASGRSRRTWATDLHTAVSAMQQRADHTP
jgi:1-acyl-sn-glycerol-3-phosphate acyltransferase